MSSRPSFAKKNTSSVEPLKERPKAQPSTHPTPNINDAGGSLRSRSPAKSRPVAKISPHSPKNDRSSRTNSATRESTESSKRVSFINEGKGNQTGKNLDPKTASKPSKSRPTSKPRDKVSVEPKSSKKPEPISKSHDPLSKSKEKSKSDIPQVVVSAITDDSIPMETLKSESAESTSVETSLIEHNKNLKISSVEDSEKENDTASIKSDSTSVIEEETGKSLSGSKSPVLTRPVTGPVSDEPSPKSKHSKMKFKFPGRSKEKTVEKSAPSAKPSVSGNMEVVTLPKERMEVCIDKVFHSFTEVDRNLQRHVLSKLQSEVELNTKKPATLAVKTRYHRLKRLEGILGELNAVVVKISDWFKKQDNLDDEVLKSIEQGLLKVEYILNEMNDIWSSVFAGAEKSLEDKMNAFHDLLDRLFTDLIEFIKKVNNMKPMRDNNLRAPFSNDKMAEIGMSFPMKYIEKGDEKKKH